MPKNSEFVLTPRTTKQSFSVGPLIVRPQQGPSQAGRRSILNLIDRSPRRIREPRKIKRRNLFQVINGINQKTGEQVLDDSEQPVAHFRVDTTYNGKKSRGPLWNPNNDREKAGLA